MRYDARHIVVTLGFAALLALPLIAEAFDEPFWLTLYTRIIIFAIAAVSLDLILGYGGMVSFGHAAFLGIGSYAVGILAFHGIDNGFVQWPAAIGASALWSLLIGFVCLRTSGIYFIMITLAFAQMVYFLGISLETYGGDDGMTLWNRSQFAGLIDLENDVVFYYVVLGILLAFTFVGYRLINSRFGMIIRGARSNERRMKAIGFPVFRYKLVGFVIAGTMCGIAGALIANLSEFVSPNIMHWTRSGELIIMVVLGGMGTLFGPIIGAAVFLILEHWLADITQHWMLILGPVLVLVVLFGRGGIYGMLTPREQRRG